MTTTPALLHRPVQGGVFGCGRYVLATTPCLLHGLHAVRHMVLEPATGVVLSLADNKAEALALARAAIKHNEQLAAAATQVKGADPRQAQLWPDELPPPRPIVDKTRPVSRRRRDVFAKSAGRCHYCRAPLLLTGLWHVEHMMPRALGGADDIGNLVAACPPCNLAKGDRTAVEFVANGKG